jgi:hypothetical protein
LHPGGIARQIISPSPSADRRAPRGGRRWPYRSSCKGEEVVATCESDQAQHLDAFQDLENRVGKLDAIVKILVMIRAEKESMAKAEMLFVAIENLELLMQGFAADYKVRLEDSLAKGRHEAPARDRSGSATGSGSPRTRGG